MNALRRCVSLSPSLTFMETSYYSRWVIHVAFERFTMCSFPGAIAGSRLCNFGDKNDMSAPARRGGEERRGRNYVSTIDKSWLIIGYQVTAGEGEGEGRCVCSIVDSRKININIKSRGKSSWRPKSLQLKKFPHTLSHGGGGEKKFERETGYIPNPDGHFVIYVMKLQSLFVINARWISKFRNYSCDSDKSPRDASITKIHRSSYVSLISALTRATTIPTNIIISPEDT